VNQENSEGRSWVRRLPIQVLSLVAFNGYFWESSGKYLCVPVLNCYACPIGTVACPIGSLTAFALVRRIPYYILGTLALLGLSLGRAFCGWACPFGLLQEGLYKIPSRKLRLPKVFDALKYVLLVVLVIALPLALGKGKSETSRQRIVEGTSGAIDYCALVCPAGTLEAGIPALVSNAEVREALSWRAWSKIGILVIVLGLMVVSSRSFCRALCPLGALMALTSRISLLQLGTDVDKCTRCKKCVRVCPTEARIVPDAAGEKEATSECVACLECVKQCPESEALFARLGSRTIMVSSGNASGEPPSAE
jgi:ferredoxin